MKITIDTSVSSSNVQFASHFQLMDYHKKINQPKLGTATAWSSKFKNKWSVHKIVPNWDGKGFCGVERPGLNSNTFG